MDLKKEIGRIGISLLLVFSLAIGCAYAQRLTGKITGVVTDDEGTSLPGVTVETSSPALMGGLQAQVTSQKGTYRFINLPPGTYKLVFKLEGFQAMEILNTKVLLGTTITKNVVLTPGTIEESITVVAKPPTIDVTKSGTSAHYSKEELEMIPTGRDSFMDIVKMAPGFSPSLGSRGITSIVLGSNNESSMYQIDGVDVSNPEFGSAWIFFPANVFEEVETHLLGAPAEYGQYSGAVINVVTKSGSNTLKGDISYYGQFDSLTGDNNPQPGEAQSFQRNKYYFLSTNLGGPIIKDKLWFFASVAQSKDNSVWWRGNAEFPNKFPRQQAFLKFSAQPAKNHKFSGYAYFETYSLPRATSPDVMAESRMKESSDTPSWNLLWTWQINNNAYFELKSGGHYSRMNSMPTHSTLDDPTHYDVITGITSNGAWFPWTYEVGKYQVNANLSYFAEDYLGGDHEFKFGIQYNHGIAQNQGGHSGGRAYIDYDGAPYRMYMQDTYYYGGKTDSIGAFVDDSLKIGDRVNLNLGLRFDWQNGYIHSMHVMDGWSKTDQMTDPMKDLLNQYVFSPRIGLAVQLTSDQKTLLKASYGRYYDATQIYNWEAPGPNVTDWHLLVWDGTDYVLFDTVPGEMNYSVDKPYKTPYADQFSIGLEREIFTDLSFGANFIYKKHNNLIGWEDRGATYEQVNLVSPDNGQTYAAWNQTSAAGTNDYWITNRQDFEQSYIGAIFTIDKRYSNNWLMHASLTWQKSEGLIISAHSGAQSGISRWGFGKDPNNLINANGALQNDRRVTFKLQTSYSFPLGIVASINYIYASGRPLPIFVRIYPDQGMKSILAEPRNHGNLSAAESMLDFRLSKSFDIYKTVRLHAMFDVFNVFNSDTTLDYSSANLYAANYMATSRIPFPRRLQIGLRLEF